MKFNSKHLGTHLEDLLAEDGRLEEATLNAVKSVIAWQLGEEMRKKKITKARMAEMMKTSRAQLDRVLDPESGNTTIETLQRAAKIVGRGLRVELI
jgi:DNA-binding phage protein